jgi:hypothetical protein
MRLSAQRRNGRARLTVGFPSLAPSGHVRMRRRAVPLFRRSVLTRILSKSAVPRKCCIRIEPHEWFSPLLPCGTRECADARFRSSADPRLRASYRNPPFRASAHPACSPNVYGNSGLYAQLAAQRLGHARIRLVGGGVGPVERFDGPLDGGPRTPRGQGVGAESERRAARPLPSLGEALRDIGVISVPPAARAMCCVPPAR